MKSKKIIGWILGVIIGLMVLHFLLTGSPVPIFKIESLDNPVAVTGWDSEGLALEDGRKVQLPGFISLPEQSKALSEVTIRGVEIDSNGRVYGLVRIHHWCGNDPVRKHIARIDISSMLMFLNEGKLKEPLEQQEHRNSLQGGGFTDWGWLAGQYYSYNKWVELNLVENAEGD